MFIRALHKSLFFLPVAFALLLFSTYVWIPSFLIVPVQLSGFVDNVERTFTILLVAFCSFILPDPYEIELGLVCGVKITKLAYSKFLPILLFSMVPIFIILFLYSYTPYEGDFRPIIPIFIPENYKAHLIVSFFVTVLFFSALFFFIRVLARNSYISIAICLFFTMIFDKQCKDIQGGTGDIQKCLIDPFISVYMIGDEVPNAYAERYTDLSIMHNAWTYNRILFFVLSLLLLGATYLLLRREKLHKGFGD